MKKIILENPFDAHVHFRVKQTLLNRIGFYTVNQFAGAVIMPNTLLPNPQNPQEILHPHIGNYDQLCAYAQDVDGMVEDAVYDFRPFYTYYLSADITKEDLQKGKDSGLLIGVKYYPKGGTTNSNSGLVGFAGLEEVLEVMNELGIPLLVHGETTHVNNKLIVNRKRMNVFLETEMEALVKAFPNLPMVLEHITTGAAAKFVLEHDNVRATITPQHLLLNELALMNGFEFNSEGILEYNLKVNGLRPHVHCMPVLQEESEVEGLRKALIYQAEHNLSKFGLGTDSAPHEPEAKYRDGCACGVFSAPIALELYASAFEQMGILEHLPAFVCDVMPDFYGIKDKLPKRTSVLIRKECTVEDMEGGIITPFAGMKLPWTMDIVL